MCTTIQMSNKMAMQTSLPLKPLKTDFFPAGIISFIEVIMLYVVDVVQVSRGKKFLES